MRRLFVGLVAGFGLLLSGAPAANAGPLTSVDMVFGLGTLPPAVFTANYTAGAGMGTALNATTFTMVAGAVPAGATTATIPLTSAPPISQIQVVIAGNPVGGTFAGSASPVGVMPVTGAANVKGFGGFTLLGVPIAVGFPTTTIPPTAYGIAITAWANAWTTKTTTVALTTPTQFGAVTAMATGTNMLTPGGGGTVTLVSALNILTNLAGQLPAFTSITLGFVPEPGTLFLLASGVAGLVALGRSRRG